jgi:hypothetical protein
VISYGDWFHSPGSHCTRERWNRPTGIGEVLLFSGERMHNSTFRLVSHFRCGISDRSVEAFASLDSDHQRTG